MRRLLCLFLLAGCSTLSTIVSDLKSVDAKLSALQTEQREVEQSKYSQASAQVIAANRTLRTDPEASKYTEAAIPALDVATSGLPAPSALDLLAAMDIQAKFLSGQVVAAQVELNLVRGQITEKDRKLAEMQSGIKDLVKAKQEVFEELQQKVLVIDQDNKWYNNINPLQGFWKGLKRLAGWVIVFVILGLFLRIASFFFPQVEVIRWIGRLMVYPFKLILSWIPDALRAFGAVKHEEYLREKAIADRVVGAVQEFKNANPDDYKNKLRENLLDWMKDKPELAGKVEKKLVELNLR